MQGSCNNDKDVGVAIGIANHCFHAFLKHHYITGFGGNHMLEVSIPSFVCVWNQMSKRNLRTLGLPSMIRRLVKNCDVADRFLRKPFWFFLKVFSTLVRIRLKSWALLTLAAIAVRIIPLVFSNSHASIYFLFWGHLSWGKERCCLSSIPLLCFDYTQHSIIEVVCRQIFLSSTLHVVFRRDRKLSCS